MFQERICAFNVMGAISVRMWYITYILQIKLCGICLHAHAVRETYAFIHTHIEFHGSEASKK
jgi:hypothetical protein